jgi:hypothetical protein
VISRPAFRGRSSGGLACRQADPTDSTYQVEYAVLLREPDGTVTVRRDQHVEGQFPRARWLGLLAADGFEDHWVADPEGRSVFVGRRPSG